MEAHEEGGDKVGLALSGGGFRAAFFHIGVLARLAEIGVLRKVEVISTVSGGSIVGALYYLRLKKLLESTPDGDPNDFVASDMAYCDLVREVEMLLRKAVRRNLRSRVTSNLFKNLYMASPRYSRSTRMGDLYDRYMYKGALEVFHDGRWQPHRERRWHGLAERRIELRELKVTPQGRDGVAHDGFRPKLHNHLRENKVPALLINATALNSGHNWRFEAIRMGESDAEDAARAGVVDRNMQRGQVYFDAEDGRPNSAEEKVTRFPLARAVAASAGVPGIFHPITVNDLYGGIDVQLVDGGVQDNQGLQGLLDHDCTHVIVSDASHQMTDEDKPPAALPAVSRRSWGIASDRIRDLQLLHLDAGRRERKAATMDLRRGLDARVVLPIDSEEEAAPPASPRFSFGVDRKVQGLLAGVRTDLDFFSKAEAFSLELDGYLISRQEMRTRADEFRGVGSPAQLPDAPERWLFRKELGKLFAESPAPAGLSAHLEAAKSKFFRPLMIEGAYWVALIFVLVIGALVALVFGVLDGGDWLDELLPWNWPVPVKAVIGGLFAVTVGTYAGSISRSSNVQRVCSTVSGVLLPLILALPAFLWSVVQLLAQPLRRFGNRLPPKPRPPIRGRAPTP